MIISIKLCHDSQSVLNMCMCEEEKERDIVRIAIMWFVGCFTVVSILPTRVEINLEKLVQILRQQVPMGQRTEIARV